MKLKKQINRGLGRIMIGSGVLFLICFLCWWFLLPVPLFQSPYSTVVLDREQRVLGVRVAGDEQLRFRESGRLPAKYAAAVMAFEDKRFMLHKGVDWLSLGRAFWQNLSSRRIVSGGSTLSMQVIRLSRGNPPRTWWEKAKEVLLTLRLEQSYTKGQILGMYASHAPFGGNVVGIQAASLKYFNRRPEQLSWAEAALLAVLPNAPALIFPGKNNTLLKQKRDGLLKKLYAEGLLPADDLQLALSEPLPEKLYEIPSITPHLLALAEQERNGRESRTFIDRNLQRRVGAIVDRHCKLLSHNYIYNAAVLVAHIPTGEVRAYVGNSGALPGSRGNDVDIIRSVRSSGSILKPALYALMQQNGFILPQTLIPDIPSRFGGYAPSNFNRDFQGAVPASEALTQSLNIPFVRMLRDYSYNRFYEDLKQLGIRSLNREADHYGLSLILGGAETSLWDICNMYAGMMSVLRHYNEFDGQYFTDEYRRLKLWHEPEAGERKTGSTESPGAGGIDTRQPGNACSVADVPLKASSVWLTLKAMQDVERPEMEAGWKNFASAMNLSWKTGTSFGFRDAWAVGVNAEYVIGVWVGNADGEGRPGLVGTRAAAPILFEVASLLHTARRFYEPAEELISIKVCHRSGFRASEFCPEVDTVRACESGLRTDVCPFHRLVNLDATGRWQVNSNCETVYNMNITPWFVLPPVQEWYYCRTHTDYRKLPPFREDCSGASQEVMEMIYPQRGTRIFIPRSFGGKPEKVILEAAHRIPSAVIFWDIDGNYLGQTQGTHQMEANLPEGRHVLVLTDGDGNIFRQTFRIVGRSTDPATTSEKQL